jgi:hypothetical protein
VFKESDIVPLPHKELSVELSTAIAKETALHLVIRAEECISKLLYIIPSAYHAIQSPCGDQRN